MAVEKRRMHHGLRNDTDGDPAALIQPWPSSGTMGAETRGLLTESDGVYVHDADGRRLIDGPAGMWCVNVGHRNEALIGAMSEQARGLAYNSPWYTTTRPADRLAEELAARAPGNLDHVFFTTGGSSAVETALRLMQFANNLRGRPGKKLIVSRQAGYHGSTYLSASLNGRPRDHDWMDSADHLVRKLTAPDPFRRPEGMDMAAFEDFLVDEFAALIRSEGAERIGAFVAEPVQASGGVIVPPPGYLARMAQLCSENDILYISDEVVTAFGRLGSIFASRDVFGVQPDMITFAKGVTSGYFPLGGVMVSSDLLEAIRSSGQSDATFSHGLTYSSHPIGCAVALKNLELLEAGILEHVREISPYFLESLKRLERHALVGEVRGMGLMACVECVADRDSKNPLALDLEVGKRIDRHAQELGLLVRPLINMCVMSPPLTIDRGQIDRLADILDTSICRTMDDLTREGLWKGR